jgi:hypothetical protein
LQEVDMVDRRQLPLGLLAEHHGAVARLVAADELAQELRVILRLVAIGATTPATPGRTSATHSA